MDTLRNGGRLVRPGTHAYRCRMIPKAAPSKIAAVPERTEAGPRRHFVRSPEFTHAMCSLAFAPGLCRPGYLLSCLSLPDENLPVVVVSSSVCCIAVEKPVSHQSLSRSRHRVHLAAPSNCYWRFPSSACP